MKTIHITRSVLAALFPLLILVPTPALAQGEGPLSTCLAQAAADTAAFEACLVEHQDELAELYNLPADWRTRIHDYLAAHPGDWDELEDIADRLENRWDRAESHRDRWENRFDRYEDRHDEEVDLEDLFDRREDVRDRAENRWDRREGARDRIENRWDRQH